MRALLPLPLHGHPRSGATQDAGGSKSLWSPFAGQKHAQFLALCPQVSCQEAQFGDFQTVHAGWPGRHGTIGQGVPGSDGVEPLSQPAAVPSEVSVAENGFLEGMAHGVQELLWQDLFREPTQWWDNTRSKEALWDPDLRHNKPEALWLSNWYVLESRVATLDAQADAGTRRQAGYSPTFQGVSASLAAHEGELDVETYRKLCEKEQVNEAVQALSLLVQKRCHIPKNHFYRVLKRCIAQNDLVLGRRIHALTVEGGFEGNAFLATHLIGLYASHGRLEEAMRVFSKVFKADAHNWAAIILAYARHGEPNKAIMLYRQMRESTVKPDNRVFLAVLKACGSAGDLAAGRDVHAHILANALLPDIFVQNCLVDMYAKCESLQDARRVFDRLSQKNVVTWTTMIAGYAQQGLCREALNLYCNMQQDRSSPNSVTFVCLLQACAGVGVAALDQGKELHAQIVERGLQDDVAVGNSLLHFYAKCGSLEDARSVFDGLSQKDVVTWTAMIAGFAQQGLCQEALDLYGCMRQECISPPNSVTFVCLLQACAGVGKAALNQGKQLHAQIEEQGMQADVVVGGSLVNMYVQCESLDDAQRVFHGLPQKNVVTWTAMIAGYAQQGLCQEALSLYTDMEHEGITPANSVTFVCLLQACATVAALPLGKQLHAQIEERGFQADVKVGSSLVNMYAKCGSMVDSQQVFDSLSERDNVAWDALIAGYTRQGDSEVVFDLLDRMRLEGIQPNGTNLLHVLTVCSHVGLVDEGRKHFAAMSTDYGIPPSSEHYRCMMDLLGRAGHLDEALQMAKTMPFQPNVAVWLTLLGACRKWSNLEVGRHAFEFAVRLDEKNATTYALMSNIYASAQMWEEAKEMHARRENSGAYKESGQSWWTDIGGVVHAFVVGDRKHPESEVMYGRLEQLVCKLKKEGDVPCPLSSSPDDRSSNLISDTMVTRLVHHQ